MSKTRSPSGSIRHGLFVLMVLLAAGLSGYLAKHTAIQWDISQNQRHTLSQGSLEVLQKLDGPVTVTVYATIKDDTLGDIRKLVSDFISLYQRIKPDISVTFIDPVAQPGLVQKAGVEVNGEMVISYGAKSDHLTTISEKAFTSMLMKLARTEERTVMVLTGHGERRIDGVANHDLGEFGNHLVTRGFRMVPLNLAIAQEIPHNTSVLVIPSPQTDLLPGEIEALLAYTTGGGNVLWLVDQEPLHGLQKLADHLGLVLTPGIVVDPQAAKLKAPITFALGTQYAEHPVTHHFDFNTVFPFARQIAFHPSETWQITSLVEAAQQGWVETGELAGEINFDETRDIKGPINVATALSRRIKDHEQRIAVIGSGHFLANTYLGNGNNLDLGINLINWLSGDEGLITIQPRPTIDSNLTLDKTALTMIAFGTLIVLPLFFLVSGSIIWWQRRYLPARSQTATSNKKNKQAP